MRNLACAFWLLAFGIPTQSIAQSRQALLQYQYNVDVARCSATLSNGLRIEFGGVFANEDGNIALHEMVNLGFTSPSDFPFAAVVSIRGGGKQYLAKVVWKQGSQVKLATDSQFLNDFWGMDDVFAVYSEERGGKYLHTFSMPEKEEEARITLSRARSCQIAASRVD